MRPVRLLVILLVVATLLVDLVVVSWVVASGPLWSAGWPQPAVVVLYALCMAQVGLVAVWTGFGGKSLPWRILGLVLTIGLWCRLLPWHAYRERQVDMVTQWTCLLLAESVVILVPLGAARLIGLRLVRTYKGRLPMPVATGQRRLQFSLGYLLSWITVLAVVLGLARFTLDLETALGLLDLAWWLLLVLVVSLGGLVLASLWAVLGTARLWLRCLVAVLTIAAIIVANLLGTGVEEPWPDIALYLLQVLWVVASLSVFRVAGYRMTRTARARAAEPPAAPDAS